MEKLDLDQLNVMTSKGREYAYLGMYEEAINNFDNVIKTLHENINVNKNNLNLKQAYENLLKQISEEQGVCKLLDKSIKTGSTGKVSANPQAQQIISNDNKAPMKPNNDNKPVDHNKLAMENQNHNKFQNKNNQQNQLPTPKLPVIKKNSPRQQNNYNNNKPGGNYVRPGTKGKKAPEPKGPKNADGSFKKDAFLLHVYPDGKGPDEELVRMLEKEVVDRSPNITFDQVAELDRVKEILFETVIFPLTIPSFYKGIRKPRKGVLLFGPPGTGKTMLAKALATTAKTSFFNVMPSTLASKWKGDSEKLVRLLFDMARFYAPTTIFIDEIDALCSKRGGSSGGGDDTGRKMKAEFLVQVDGANTNTGETEYDENGKELPMKLVTVQAATNNPWDLDDAIIRRLEKRIHIPLPTDNARRILFQLKLKDTNHEELDYNVQVKETVGYSGSDIENVCRDASFMPLNRISFHGNWQEKIDYLKNNEQNLANQVITMVDFSMALKNVRPSVPNSVLERYAEWMNQQGSG